jgi:hypothetical protein
LTNLSPLFHFLDFSASPLVGVVADAAKQKIKKLAGRKPLPKAAIRHAVLPSGSR